MYVCMYFEFIVQLPIHYVHFFQARHTPTPTLKTLANSKNRSFLSGLSITTVLHPWRETPERQPVHQHEEVQGSVGQHAQQQVAGWGPAAIRQQRRRKKAQAEKLQ